MNPPMRQEASRFVTQYTSVRQQTESTNRPSIELRDFSDGGSHEGASDGSDVPAGPSTVPYLQVRSQVRNQRPTTNTNTSSAKPRPPIPQISISSDDIVAAIRQHNESQDGDISNNAAHSSASKDGKPAERQCLISSSTESIRWLGDNHLAIDDFEYEHIPTSEAVGYPPLNYKPWPIQTWCLIFTMVIFLSCIGGIVTMIILGRSLGSGFHISKSRDHLAYRYVPPAIGTFTTIWWRTIITTLARITPYLSIAAENKGKTGHPHTLQRFLQNDYAHTVFEPIDLTSVAASHHWMLFGCLVIQFIIMIIIVPLKAVFIQLVRDHGGQGWNVTVVPTVGYTLIGIYGTLTLVTFLVLMTIRNQETGLIWDPASIADQLALVQGSNVLGIFQGLEFAVSKQCTKVLRERSPSYGSIRLGYWRHKKTGEIWHGLACIPPPLGSEERADAFKAEEVLRKIKQNNLDGFTLVGNRDDPLDYDNQRVPNSEEYRYYSAPPLLNDALLAAYAAVLITVIGLTITGLVDRRIQRAFDSIFSIWTLPDKTKFLIEELSKGAEGFRYRFLPVFLMTVFSAIWIRADVFYRWTEPFSRMDKGADAKSSILLDYASCPPVFVTIKAALRCHWRVAMFSTLALISTGPPIVATGVFLSTTTPTGYTIAVEPINFWACFSVLIFYLFCLIPVRPPPSYRLPRSLRSIADVLSYCYASRLLDDHGTDGNPLFSPHPRDDKRMHMKYRICLTKKKYLFGLYLGKDGKQHIGFDVDRRDGEGGRQVEVIRFDAGAGVRGLWPDSLGSLGLWKKPHLINQSV